MGDRQTSRRGGNPDELIPGDHEAGWTTAEPSNRTTLKVRANTEVTSITTQRRSSSAHPPTATR